jgi:hypothetical protein
VHDLDQEEEPVGSHDDFENQPDLEPPPTPPVRPRKAKETQKRLGVGRPIIAGGSGARAVTKSQSVSRGKRGKSSRRLAPAGEPIQEGMQDIYSCLLPLICVAEPEEQASLEVLPQEGLSYSSWSK